MPIGNCTGRKDAAALERFQRLRGGAAREPGADAGKKGQCRRSIPAVHLLRFAVVLATMHAAASVRAADPIFGDGFELPCPGAAAGVTAGIGSALLLRGTVVTPTVAFVGEVLVQGDTIACAAASCAGQPGAGTATIIETQGLIFPGLINTRDVVLYDMFDENDWAPSQVYANHNSWTIEARYGALVNAKQYLNGEGSGLDDGCEMDKYGELKGLIAGTTSIVGAANPANKKCYGSLARTIEQTSNDLGADYIQIASIFPSTSAADSVCANFTSGSTHAYLIDIAEGTDATALNEFAKLGTITTTDLCLYAPQTAIIHGTALGAAEYATMAAAGMSLVWTPHSDVALYGQSANVPLALGNGINVSLGSNWSITGSHNLLDALRHADGVDNSTWGNVLTPYDLVQMVTTHAAKTLALDAVLGSIDAGKKADLTVVAGPRGACVAPWTTLVNARPSDLRLVMVGGVPLYGDTAMQAAAPAAPGCEALDVCGVAKFVCVAEPAPVTDKLDQTLADIVGILTRDLADYDALNLSQWKFSPITPLVDCP